MLFCCCKSEKYWIWSKCHWHTNYLYGWSPPVLLTWNVGFLRTPQKSHLVLDLVHNIFCKQNLVASNSLLGNINLLENNNFTWSATSVGSGKILYGIMKWELSKRCAEFESYRHSWGVLRCQQSTSIKIFTYIYVRCLCTAVHSTSNGSGETRKPEMVLSFYVYVHLVFKVYTCMSYLRNVMCVKWELECKEKKQNPSINHWWKTVEITLNSNNEII